MIKLLTNSNAECGHAVRADRLSGRIAVVLPAFAGGGAQRDVILLANGLAARGEDVVILVLRGEGPLRQLVDPAISIVEIPGRRIRYAIPGLRRAFQTVGAQIVLSSESNLNLFCLAAARSLPVSGRPKIVLREVASPSAAQQFDPYWQNRLAYRVLRRCYRYADRVITLTDGARRDLMENFSIPAAKIAAMTSNAVITDDVAARIAGWDGEQGRERNLVVSVGRLSPEKDHRTLLRAMTMSRPELPWRLAIVGDGPERPALEAFVHENGLGDRVAFVGYVNDPFAWMMRASVAVCSSAYEGLCNAIIEALGCGTPVVSTNCPYGPPEILQHGRYGKLVPIGDAAQMASAIDAALIEPVDRARLMERARNYTATRAAENFVELLADL